VFARTCLVIPVSVRVRLSSRTYLAIPVSFRVRLCLLEHAWLYQCPCSPVFARTCLVIRVSVHVRLCLLEHTWLYECLFMFVCVC
jgi:hypothetical protein